MKFYIASTLSNADMVQKIASYLKLKGWAQTYDWTKHVPVLDMPGTLLGKISEEELRGVMECDVFFLLLPGKRGSHAELGAALASNKPVILLSTNHDLFSEEGLLCSFHWHPKVEYKLVDQDWFNLAYMAHRAGKNYHKKQQGSCRCSLKPIVGAQ